VPRRGEPVIPPINEQLTMASLPCFRIWRSSNFMQFHTPRKVDANNAVEILAGGISSLRNCVLNARIVIGRIQLSEGGDCLIDHRFYLSVVSHVAFDSEYLVAFGSQAFGRRADGVLVAVGQYDRGA